MREKNHQKLQHMMMVLSARSDCESNCSISIPTGESGSGKTVTSNVIMKMLVYLGRAPYRNIEDKILQINPVLEAFGNAPTRLNDNSSRYFNFFLFHWCLRIYIGL